MRMRSRPNAPARRLAWPLLAPLCVLPACHEHHRSGFEDHDPAARINSIHDAASTNDRSSIPDLIRSLDSDDPAERLLAIRTLEKLTGQTLGYDHSAPRPERSEAAQRWADWYAQQAPKAD
jgi:hypothetical protein